jgi:hypothetical protein
MTEMHSLLYRLEARIDHQAARIDALHRELEERGILADATQAHAVDPLFDELVDPEDAPFAIGIGHEPRPRRATRLRVGDATGV